MDNAQSSVVVLTESNYTEWSGLMRNYLTSQDLWDVIAIPTNNTQSNDPEWSRKNDEALKSIQRSCRKDIFDCVKDVSSAKNIWDALETLHHNYYLICPGILEDYDRSELMLHRDLRRGDCDALKRFLVRCPNFNDWVIFHGGLTVVHVASTCDHVKIVEKLVTVVSEGYLEKTDENGDTVLSLAASNGNVKIAKCLVKKNNRLLNIRNNKGNIPLVVACINRRRHMTSYLYYKTRLDFSNKEDKKQGALFLKYSVLNGMPGIGVDLYRRCPSLAADREHSITLQDLSVQKSLFLSTTWIHLFDFPAYIGLIVQLPSPTASKQGSWKRKCISLLETIQLVMWTMVYLPGIFFRPVGICNPNMIYKIKLTHTYAKLVLRNWCETISTYRNTRELAESGAISAIFQAIKSGINDVVIDILKVNPDLILSNKKLSSQILISIIKCRQDDILRFIYKLEAGRKAFHSFNEDQGGNNLLHLVAKLPECSTPWKLSRELKRFQEFESVLPAWYGQAKNLDGETPTDIFDREHQNLMKEAVQQAKKTAESYSIIATLIVTITFAAAFTVPGGNDQNNDPNIGFPVFLNRKSFHWFVTCDVVSLFSASTSILLFLMILTSSYNRNNFYRSLPNQLMGAILAFVIAMVAMILAFFFAVTLMLFPGEFSLQYFSDSITLMLLFPGEFSRDWTRVTPIIAMLSCIFPLVVLSLSQLPTLHTLFRMIYYGKILG